MARRPTDSPILQLANDVGVLASGVGAIRSSPGRTLRRTKRPRAPRRAGLTSLSISESIAHLRRGDGAAEFTAENTVHPVYGLCA
jgi:hypothetical protein